MDRFQFVLHAIYTQPKKLRIKVALTPRDDKIFVIPGTFRTSAWGLNSIK